MDYQTLRAAPLADLAALALDPARAPHTRLAPWEALQARIDEVGKSWTGFDPTERETIREALALDLSHHGWAG